MGVTSWITVAVSGTDLSMRSCTSGGATRVRVRSTNHFMAILTGVVRQAVNRSAGSSGFMGRLWPAAHAPSWMQFLYDTCGGGAPSPPPEPEPLLLSAAWGTTKLI